MKDALIIGAGPAGISAAINIKRANYDVSVVTNGDSALKKAERIDNFYGSSHINGNDLYRSGITQSKELGCEIISDEALALSYGNGSFICELKDKKIEAKTLIIAAGTSRNIPNIDGIKEFEGKGISYCAVCDGFFFRGKNVCVLGSGNYALHEAEYLKNIAKSVTVLTNSQPASFENVDKIAVNKNKIAKFTGGQTLDRVVFTNGDFLVTDGIFVAEGTASSTDFAKKLGIMLEGNFIKVDGKMATNIDGVFAAGDCTGTPYQIAKAVYDGMTAAFSAIEYLKSKK